MYKDVRIQEKMIKISFFNEYSQETNAKTLQQERRLKYQVKEFLNINWQIIKMIISTRY